MIDHERKFISICVLLPKLMATGRVCGPVGHTA